MTTESATKGRILWRGVAALLGIFAGLCTIFALVVTAAEAWQEHAEAQWPEATARIDRCYLHQTSTRRRNQYYIDCRLSYVVGTDEIAAHVYSGNVPSREVPQYPPNQIGPLEDWVDRHPSGTQVVVRYDPTKPSKMVLVATDMPRASGPHTANNLKLLGFFAASSVLLLLIARIWRLRADAVAAAAREAS
jgi:Protein of unknown function (DUF3592)